MKMWRMTATALLACLSASYADPLQDEDPSCDFRGLRLREELSRVLPRLANVPAMRSQELSPYFPGLEIAEFTLEGLDGLILYGPITPYCINGTRMLQADFINDGRAITFSLPWKTCSGHEGLFKVRATLFRFTAQFRVMVSSGEGVKLETTSRIVPVVTQDLRAFVEGAGPEVREASEMLSALLPGLLEEFWYWQFSFEFDRRFRHATQ